VKFTVFGGRGYIGSALVSALKSRRVEVQVIGRGDQVEFDRPLGHVIYLSGVTGDFRHRLADLVESNVAALTAVLHRCNFHSLLFVSSTRVYRRCSPELPAKETAPLIVEPGIEATYDLSKLLAESLCLAHSESGVRVVRLSNVCGPAMTSASFLGAILNQLKREDVVRVEEHMQSSRDYVYLGDVVDMLPRIALEGRSRIYNLASGENTTHADLARMIHRMVRKQLQFTGSTKGFAPPPVDVSAIVEEFGFGPRRIEEVLADIFAAEF
jgi:nucleoside-diphosphate-sugar epimerase